MIYKNTALISFNCYITHTKNSKFEILNTLFYSTILQKKVNFIKDIN